MTFTMGLIVGCGIGLAGCSIFYMWMLRVVINKRDDSSDEFKVIQKTNGEQIERIANAIERWNEHKL